MGFEPRHLAAPPCVSMNSHIAEAICVDPVSTASMRIEVVFPGAIRIEIVDNHPGASLIGMSAVSLHLGHQTVFVTFMPLVQAVPVAFDAIRRRPLSGFFLVGVAPSAPTGWHFVVRYVMMSTVFQKKRL